MNQALKLEQIFRHYLKLGGEETQLASRIVGSGFFAYDSKELPFIKQFFLLADE
jgi:hypothetical protein